MAEEFLAVEAKFELLRPMLPESKLFSNFNKNHYEAHGFQLLRITLLIDCIKDAVKVVLERGKKSPSLKCLMAMLANESIREQIKNDYSNIRVIYEEPLAPNIENIINKSENIQEEKRKKIFEKKYSQLEKSWAELETSNLSSKLKGIRNKVAAHLEITKNGQSYRLRDISDFGLDWTDLEKFLNIAKPLIFEIALLTCFTNYDLDGNLEIHRKISSSFWGAFKSS